VFVAVPASKGAAAHPERGSKLKARVFGMRYRNLGVGVALAVGPSSACLVSIPDLANQNRQSSAADGSDVNGIIDVPTTTGGNGGVAGSPSGDAAPPAGDGAGEPSRAQTVVDDADAAGADDANAAGAADAPEAAARCDVNLPFKGVVAVGGLPENGATLRLSPDELTGWWDDPQGNLWTGTRANLLDAFTGQSLGSFTGYDAYPTVTGDLMTLYFEDLSLGTLHVATRSAVGQPFVGGGLIGNFSYLQSIYITPDGSTLYFGWFGSAGNGHVYCSTYSDGTFAPPAAVAGIASTAEDTAPVISSDLLTIYWGSTRTDFDSGTGGVQGAGLLHIYVAHRASPDGAFGSVAPVAEVNSTSTDYPLWLSPDGCDLYLTSLRGAPYVFLAQK